jgi:hypothetical protein
MGLDRTPGHLQLFGNLRIVTALQQQIGDLLLPWTQPNGLVCHAVSPQELICTNNHHTGSETLKSPPSAPSLASHEGKKQKFGWFV